MTNELIDSLLRKIWITRKCRIVASERLEKAELYAQFIFIYYSVILVCLSIWNLFPEHSNSALSLISVIASIGLLSVSLFITSRNYRNRAIALKSCYIKLDQLYTKLQIIKADNLEAIEKKQIFL
ncbi:SLATT domain-containing protein [Desulfosporosinus sp. I2]|uniref:SLATT domain-containing protein n=1 Tax=Desulfosporosinus sp. I2 TaxID=1617025 RepID=UPI001FA6B33C|nr:SLATT domain-containing protein [Desulfosporosinus sp. I2]